MIKCALDIKKDIVDKAGQMLSKRGAYVSGNTGYFPNPKMASRAWEVNKEFDALVVKDGEKGSFFIDPPQDLVELYFEEYKKNEAPYTEQTFRPEGFYMGDEALAEQEKRDLFFQVGNGAVFTQKMKDQLLRFLNGLNIKVEFNADELLNSREYNRNPLAAFDVLQKFMAFASGQEKLLPQQVAAAAYTFLGKKSTLSKALWREIRNWEKYDQTYSAYDRRYADEEVNVENEIAGEDYTRNPNFNPFAHKMAIIKFLEESMIKVSAGETATKKRENEDIDKDYFLKRGRLDVFEKDISPLTKIFREVYNWLLNFVGQPLFEKYNRNDLTQIGLDIAEDVLKGDYQKFIRGIVEKDGKLYNAKGEELEVKDYASTLQKDVTAYNIIKNLISNPFINYKISGSLSLRKYGSLFRWVKEDLHDIDGVIPLEIFENEPSAYEFMSWLQGRGLPMIRDRKFKQFNKEVTPWIEDMVWYKNMKSTIPGFQLENIFIGRDHKNGESITIQGKAQIGGTEYKFDFFLRTAEGAYPEIFDNYWKDWKQIFEAKLNMGRSKDLADLVYFDPFVQDKYKFTNKGFRYFAFEEADVTAQLNDVPASTASDETIALVKEAAKKMGIDIQSLTDYARKTGLDTTSINGVADLVRGVIAVSENKENVALTEELVHIATAILEQTNPKLVTEMISKIGNYKIYKTVLEKYKNNKYYQLPNGKPDIRKIKKEAVDKLIAELIINQNEGSTEFPELMEEENRSIIQSIWRMIKDAISRLYKKSNVDVFREAAKIIATGEVGGTVSDIVSQGEIYLQLSDAQKNIQQKILSTTDNIEKKVGDTKEVDPLLSDTEEASNFYQRTKSDGSVAKVTKRVTDRVKAWYKELFGTKKFTEQEQKFNELKREFGVKGHLDLEEIHGRYFNQDGTRKSKPDMRPKKFNVESQDIYDKLEKYYVDLIKTFPKDTIIMSEVVIYDPKQDEAGTIDFLAIEPSGKTHILDWKFMHIRGEDVAWFKQGAFNIQLKRYKEILRDNYGVTNFGMNRAIPISMEFGLKNRLDPDKGYKVKGIAIGSANPADIEDIKLIPIAEQTESTGEEDLDELIKKLNALLKQIESKRVGEDEREFKIERLNVLRQAIRIMQATKNIAPVIEIIEVMRKEGERILNDYDAVYKNRPATSSDNRDPDLSDFADDMNDYIKTAEIFTNIGDDIGYLIYSSEMEKEAKTKKQKEALKERKQAAEKLREEASAIYRSRKRIVNASREFADKHIGQRNLVTGLLRPEKVIKGLSSTFRGISELPSAALNVLYKLTQVATLNASADSIKEVEKLIDIRKRIMERGGDPRTFVQKLYQKDDKGGIVNKLIHKFSKEFRETVDDKFNQGGDRKWLLANIDVDAYMAEAKEVMSRRIEQIKKQTYPGTKEEVAKQRKKAIEQVLKQYDIKRVDFEGGNNYIIKKHPLPKWYSKEYQEVLADKDLKELFDYVTTINEKAKDVGYINNMVAKTFLPFVRKSMAESLAWDNVLTAMGKWNDGLKLRAEDVGYGKINEITGELENAIPKYYTHDFTQAENGVNDYSDVSEDLFKNLILYTQQVNKYKYLSEVEGQIKLVKTIEEFKEHHLATDRSNKLVFKNNEPEKLKGNKENAKMFDEFMRAVLYGQKYVLTDSDTPLYIGKVMEFMKSAVNKVAGREVFKPKEQVTPTSMIKTIDAANRAFQIKTLGLEIVPGIVNMFGGNIQMATQAGHYFKFKEFASNERKILNMEFTSNEDKQMFVELMNIFMPLKDDPSSELYKEAGMSKFTNVNIGDMLMITMRYPEQLMEKATFLTLLENMMVVDGKIVNIREYVKAKNKDRYASADRAMQAKENIEKEINELKKTKSIAVTKKMENGKLVIPGLDLNNRQEIQRLTRLSRRISRNAMGAAAEGDTTRASMSIWIRSMMVFKGWIPKLLDTRFSEFRKISDDFSVEVKDTGNGEVITEGEKYDIGRLRLLAYVLMRSFQEKGTSITNILKLNDKGLSALDDLYEDFARTYYERTGEALNMSKEDFIDMVHTNLGNQIKELQVLALMIASKIALGYMAPDDDEDKASKNAFRFTQRVADKFVSELSFFYNPLEFEKMLSGNAFPAIGLITDITKFFSHFFMQITGLDLSDTTKSYDEVVKDAKPIKYAAKSLPLFKSALTYGAILSEDFAKEFDITIQKEAR